LLGRYFRPVLGLQSTGTAFTSCKQGRRDKGGDQFIRRDVRGRQFLVWRRVYFLVICEIFLYCFAEWRAEFEL